MLIKTYKRKANKKTRRDRIYFYFFGAPIFRTLQRLFLCLHHLLFPFAMSGPLPSSYTCLSLASGKFFSKPSILCSDITQQSLHPLSLPHLFPPQPLLMKKTVVKLMLCIRATRCREGDSTQHFWVVTGEDADTLTYLLFAKLHLWDCSQPWA